jgi:hypothetical protein
MEVYYYDEYLRSIAREQPTFMGQSKIGAWQVSYTVIQ